MFTNDDWGTNHMMNGSYGGGMTGTGLWMMWILGLVFMALVAIGILFLVKMVAADHPRTSPSADRAVGSPKDVLDQRLARGEISPEEYTTTRTLLGP